MIIQVISTVAFILFRHLLGARWILGILGIPNLGYGFDNITCFFFFLLTACNHVKKMELLRTVVLLFVYVYKALITLQYNILSKLYQISVQTIPDIGPNYTRYRSKLYQISIQTIPDIDLQMIYEGVKSRFLISYYDFLPPGTTSYIKIILGGKVGSYG